MRATALRGKCAPMNKPFAPPTLVQPPPGGFTADEFMQMVDCGAFSDMRVELAGGYLERMSPANIDHGSIAANVIVDLGIVSRSAGLIIATDLAVRIDDLTVRGPDVTLLREATGQGAVPGSKILLAVEVADTSLPKDLGPKLREYARAGIPTYWVVDVQAKAVRVLTEPEGEEYRRAAIVRFGEPLAVPETNQTITIG
jgi:Uma2 family endonuclease